MRRVLLTTLFFFGSALALYLAGAFISLDWDVSAWSPYSRAVLVGLAFVFTLLGNATI